MLQQLNLNFKQNKENNQNKIDTSFQNLSDTLPKTNIIPSGSDTISNVKDMRKLKFKPISLPSKYNNLLGKLPNNFKLLLWGAPGHGKSSLALILSNDLAKKFKTIYISAEESLNSATLSSRIKRFKANAKNLNFNDTNDPDVIEKLINEQDPKFIVIDSINVIAGKIEPIINLMMKYNTIGFIIIAQATKNHKNYSGLGTLAHAVDIVINIKNGEAIAEKNRYAQLGNMIVQGVKL
jgi:predicted ATP-dependent serine protease